MATSNFDPDAQTTDVLYQPSSSDQASGAHGIAEMDDQYSADIEAVQGGVIDVLGRVQDRAWFADWQVRKGQRAIGSDGSRLQCTVAGTTGSTEPTWPTTIGGTVTDNGVTWQSTWAPAGIATTANTLVKADNLADVASPATALANLGGLPLAGGTMTGNLNAPVFDKGGQVFNIKHPAFGAKCDGKLGASGTVAAASTAFTDTAATFTAADTGKTIVIQGAGASGAALTTTVTYVSATAVTLAVAASTAVSDASYAYGTDDTAAITAAATLLNAVGGGTLLHPPGAVSLVSSLTFTSFDGLHIEGGRGATVIGTTPASPPLKLQSCSNFSVRGLTIQHASVIGWMNPNTGGDPTGTTSGGHVIALFSCSDGTVEGNVLEYATSAGVFASTCTRVAIKDNRIRNVYGSGIFVCNYQGTSCQVSVTGNKIIGSGDDAIALVDATSETQSSGHVVSGNTIQNGGSRGIVCCGPAHVDIGDNIIDTTSASGILFGSDATYGTLTSTHVNIHDNDIKNSGLLGTLRGNGYGIEGTSNAGPPTLSKVHDNTVDTTHALAFSIAGAGNEIYNNHALNAGSAGFGNAANDQRYEGNIAESSQGRGFDLESAARLHVLGNIARNNNLSQTASTNNFHLANLTDSTLANNRSYDANGYTTNAFNAAGASTSNVTFEGNIATGTYIGVKYNLAVGCIARNNPGYNPVGVVTVTVPASGTAVAAAVYDRTFYVTASTSTVTMAIQGGPSPVIPASGFASIRVPAGQTVTPTYTAAPTWLVEGE